MDLSYGINGTCQIRGGDDVRVERLGELGGRSGRVTIVDVARRAGVSKSTVSLVLAGSELVAEPTRARVNRAMQALGYVYHRGAASLRAASSDFRRHGLQRPHQSVLRRTCGQH